MVKIAVLDDQKEDRERHLAYLQRFQKEYSIQMKVDCFDNGIDLIEEYKSGYSVLLLDVEMPGMDGMDVAKEIRRKDEMAGIIFITNMAQYAIRGYEVNAVDFMVKPIQYYNFAEKVKKAFSFAERRQGRDVVLTGEEGMMRISVLSIYYVEKDRNYLVYHTNKGEFRERGTMQEAKRKLGCELFAECMSGCLVNLGYVEQAGRDSVMLAGIKLPLSRRMRKEFLQNFMKYAGGGF